MKNEPYQPGAEDAAERREELLTAYLLGELDPATKAQVEADLALDDAFAARKQELADALSFVRGAFPDERLSEDAVATLLDEARLRAGENRGWRVLPPSVVRVAAGLALLMGGVLVANRFLTPDYETTLVGENLARLEAVSGSTVSNAPAEDAAAQEPQDEAATKSLRRLGYITGDSDRGRDAAKPGLLSDTRKGAEPTVQFEASVLGKVEQERHALTSTLERKRKDAPEGAYKVAPTVSEPVQVGYSITTDPAHSQFVGAVTATPNPSPSPPASAGPSSPGPVAARKSAKEVKHRESWVRTFQEIQPDQPKAGSAANSAEAARARLELRLSEYLTESRRRGEQGEAVFDFGLMDEAVLADRDGEDGYLSTESGAGQLAGLTPAQFDELCGSFLQQCRIAPGESASDMFFRYWGDHPFVATSEDALSTFAADVDTSSYTMARRYLFDAKLPPRESVRTEEFVNYFTPDVPAPLGETFGVTFELAPSAFNADPNAWLLRVAVRGKDLADFERQPLALTFVIDVSGSMEKQNRLGLVKQALHLLATELSISDSVALVAFNNDAREVLPMVSAGNRAALEDAIDPLAPGGGTNVESGLLEGFRLASEGMVPGAVNRVVFLSDGVGNIGETDQERILAKVADMRAKGIYLNTIGVGMGNHNDVFLEQLANKGDGVANYIDSAREAEKVMVFDFTKTFQPIARDVKIQVEFDPAQVREWRQLGYENRAIADAQFRDDAVDAGELNAGHQVSAVYEIVRTGASAPNALATCRLRWKEPFAVDRGDTSASGAAFAEQATERVWKTSGAEAAYDVSGASWGYRRTIVAAQLAESLRRSKHARQDDLGLLVRMAETLRNQRPQDAELAELAKLTAIAQPMLEAERGRTSPVTEVMDQLAERTYFEARLEQLEKSSENSKRSAELQGEIAKLEARLREVVAAQIGFEVPAGDPVPPRDGDSNSNERR